MRVVSGYQREAASSIGGLQAPRHPWMATQEDAESDGDDFFVVDHQHSEALSHSGRGWFCVEAEDGRAWDAHGGRDRQPKLVGAHNK